MNTIVSFAESDRWQRWEAEVDDDFPLDGTHRDRVNYLESNGYRLVTLLEEGKL